MLGIIIPIWCDNIEMYIKGTRFFKLSSSLQHGWSGIAGKGNKVILTNISNVKILQMKLFEGGLKSIIFLGYYFKFF